MPSLLRAQTVVLGDSTVGKSAISQMFESDGSHFPKSYSMTAGVTVAMKTLNMADGGGVALIKRLPQGPMDLLTVGGVFRSNEFCILDCSGKEIFSAMVEKMWEQPSLVMIVYDVTSKESFEHCSAWLLKAKKHFGNETSMPGVLVGNKKDLVQRRVVKEEEGEALAKQLGLSFCECSAKDWQSVVEAFRTLAMAYQQLFQERMEAVQSLC